MSVTVAAVVLEQKIVNGIVFETRSFETCKSIEILATNLQVLLVRRAKDTLMRKPSVMCQKYMRFSKV